MHRIVFVANVVGDNPSVLERITAIQLARREGYSKSDVAEMFGISQRQIERYLALPADMLQWIDGRVITMAHVRVIVDQFSAIPFDRLPELIEEIRSRRLSAQELPVWLEAQGFTRVTRRLRAMGKISQDRVRFYNMELSPASPLEARQRTLDFLQQAIRRIEEFGGGSNGRSVIPRPLNPLTCE